MDLPPNPRACGPCTACCEFPAVPVLDKPAGQLCRHASSGGCAIYAARPQECRDYTCLWLEGEFEAGDRPDQVGLAFDQPALIAAHPDYTGIHVICARELWPGARQGTRAASLLVRLARAMVVRLSAPDGRTELLGPAGLIEAVARRAAARRAGEGEPGDPAPQPAA